MNETADWPRLPLCGYTVVLAVRTNPQELSLTHWFLHSPAIIYNVPTMYWPLQGLGYSEQNTGVVLQ